MTKCRSCGKKNLAGFQFCQRCGAPLTHADALPENDAEGLTLPTEGDNLESEDELKARLLALLERGQKIAAIKLYRDRTGVGLKQAKDAVEAMEGQRVPAARGCSSTTLWLLAAVAGLVGIWLTF